MYILRNVNDFSHNDLNYIIKNIDKQKGGSVKGEFNEPNRIIATGDFHGDLEACKVCFRDLARIADDNGNWVGEDNTYVVLLGDMIDRKRIDSIEDNDGRTPGEIDNEEKMLLEYVNKVSETAKKAKNCKVIKCLGNHEIMNLFGKEYKQSVAAYSSKYSLGKYCNNGKCGVDQKIKLFDPLGDIGKLIGENDAYGMVKIGNWLFMHGGLSANLLKKLHSTHNIKGSNNVVNETNQIASDIFKGHDTFEGKANKRKRRLLYNLFKDSRDAIVWNRHLSSQTREINKRNLDEIFEMLKMNKKESHIVVAHTPQFIREYIKGYVYTQDKPKKDGNRLIYNGPGRKPNGNSLEHGINFDAPYNNNSGGQVWRIDVGMSRAFDTDDMSQKELFIRRPQLLEIFPATKKTRVIVANQGLTRSGLNFNDEGHV